MNEGVGFDIPWLKESLGGPGLARRAIRFGKDCEICEIDAAIIIELDVAILNAGASWMRIGHARQGYRSFNSPKQLRN